MPLNQKAIFMMQSEMRTVSATPWWIRFWKSLPNWSGIAEIKWARKCLIEYKCVRMCVVIIIGSFSVSVWKLMCRLGWWLLFFAYSLIAKLSILAFMYIYIWDIHYISHHKLRVHKYHINVGAIISSKNFVYSSMIWFMVLKFHSIEVIKQQSA